MKRIIVALTLCSFSIVPATAQGRSYIMPNGVPYGANPYVNPYTNPYVNPYANPYVNPYGTTYPYGTVPAIGAPGARTTVYPSYGYGIPQPIGGNFFGISTGGTTYNMWKAPSGYYYPWYNGGVQMSSAPIVIVQNGATQPSEPPLSTQFTDMFKYLDEQKEKGKLSEGDYKHLKRRALDLMSKERDLRAEGDGSLEAGEEKLIRADISSLGGEIARSVQP